MNKPSFFSARGFSLVEVLITLVILAGGLLALAKYQGTLLSANSIGKQRTEATMVAQQEMAILRNDAYNNVASGTGSVNGATATYALTWTVTPTGTFQVGPPPSCPAGVCHKQIVLTVTWTDSSGTTQTTQLDSDIAFNYPVNTGDLINSTTTTTTTTAGATTTTAGGTTTTAGGTTTTAGGTTTTAPVATTTTTTTTTTAAPTWTVSGTITAISGSPDMSKPTVTCSAGTLAYVMSGSNITGFTCSGIANGASETITASQGSGNTGITPTSYGPFTVTSNLAGYDFGVWKGTTTTTAATTTSTTVAGTTTTTAPPIWTISGALTAYNGADMNKVSVSGTNGAVCGFTTSAYTCTVTNGWTGNITATTTANNEGVLPSTIGFTSVTGNQVNQNFIVWKNSTPNYSVSGTLTLTGNADIAKLSVTGTNAAACTINGTTSYTCTVPWGWTGVITAATTETGDTVTPTSYTISLGVTGNVSGYNFAIAAPTRTISGSLIQGTLNPTMSLVNVTGTNGASCTHTTSSYTCTVTNNWSGDITASTTETGDSISPAAPGYVLSGVNTDLSGKNFTVVGTLRTISGTLTGVGSPTMSLVSVTASSACTTTSTSYSCSVTNGWSGNITATTTETGDTIAPASYTFSNVTSNTTGGTFTVTAPSRTISGTLSTATGANMSLVSVSGTNSAACSHTTSSYTCTVANGWTGTITPTTTETGDTFTPGSYSGTNVTANATQNFVVVAPSRTITGSLTTTTGATMSLVTVSDGAACTISGSSSYTCTVANGWTGTITASTTESGDTFAPASYIISTGVTANVSGDNFVVTAPTRTISGSFTAGSNSPDMTEISISGCPSTLSYTTSGSNKTGYTCAGITNGTSVTLTPASTQAGATFSPTSYAAGAVTSTLSQSFTVNGPVSCTKTVIRAGFSGSDNAAKVTNSVGTITSCAFAGTTATCNNVTAIAGTTLTFHGYKPPGSTLNDTLTSTMTCP